MTRAQWVCSEADNSAVVCHCEALRAFFANERLNKISIHIQIDFVLNFKVRSCQRRAREHMHVAKHVAAQSKHLQ